MLLSFLVSLIPIVFVAIFSGSIGFLSEKETNLFYVKEESDSDLRYRVRSDNTDSLEEVVEKLPANDYSEQVMEEELKKVQKKYEEDSGESKDADIPTREVKLSGRQRSSQRRVVRNPAPEGMQSARPPAAPASNYNRSTNAARPGMRNNYGSDALAELQEQNSPIPIGDLGLPNGEMQAPKGSNPVLRQASPRRAGRGSPRPPAGGVKMPTNATGALMGTMPQGKPPMSRPPAGQMNRTAPPRSRSPAPRGMPPNSQQDLGINSFVGRDAQADAEEALKRIQQGK